MGGAAAAARAGVGAELAGDVPAAAAPHLHHHLAAVVVVVVAGVAAVLLLAAHGGRPDPLGVRLHEAQRGPDAGVEQRGGAHTLPSLQYRTHDVHWTLMYCSLEARSNRIDQQSISCPLFHPRDTNISGKNCCMIHFCLWLENC